MTDASFSAAGYAVLIEDDPIEKYSSTRKTLAPVAYGSKTFSPAQLKMSIYAKEFLAIFFAFKEFGHIFWGTSTPVIILTFFRQKSFHQRYGTRVTTLFSSASRLPIYQGKTPLLQIICLVLKSGLKKNSYSAYERAFQLAGKNCQKMGPSV